jgi:hypothetical protein
MPRILVAVPVGLALALVGFALTFAQCQSRSGSAPELRPRMAAPADAQAWINPTWYVPDWYFKDNDDAGRASDNNPCVEAGAPCATFGGIQNYLGGKGTTPQLQQPTRFHMLSGQSVGQDEIFQEFNTAHGAQAILDTTAAMPTICTGTDGGFVMQQPDAGLRTSLAAPCSGADAGELVHDTVANSWATIEYFDGGAAILTTPLPNALVTTPGIPTLAEGTVAPGDAYAVVGHAAVNLKRWDTVGGDLLSGGNATASGAMVIGAEVLDPSGSTLNPSVLSLVSRAAASSYALTRFDVRISFDPLAGRGNTTYFLGDDFATGFASMGLGSFSPLVLFGGVSRALVSIANGIACGDIVFEQGANVLGPLVYFGYASTTGLGGVYLASGYDVEVYDTLASTNTTGISIWGGGTITVYPGGTFWCLFDTCAPTNVNTGALACGATSRRTYVGTVYDGGVFTNNVPITWAQVDYQGAVFDLGTGCRFTHSE